MLLIDKLGCNAEAADGLDLPSGHVSTEVNNSVIADDDDDDDGPTVQTQAAGSA